ncbi:histone-lysine N-methyltransferase SUV39H2 [Aphelenchoides avenae]|nr:histone-lysine N-methyltransferase SUV39H2 [Aphelenchus avenae]
MSLMQWIHSSNAEDGPVMKRAKQSVEDNEEPTTSAEARLVQEEAVAPDMDDEENMDPEDLVWEENPVMIVPAEHSAFDVLQLQHEEQGATAAVDEDVYEVDRILSMRKEGNKVLYYIKWKGWEWKDNTWEPRQNLGDCAEALETLDKHHYPNIHDAPSFPKVVEWEEKLNQKLREAGQAPIYVENWTGDDAGEPEELEFILKNIIPDETKAKMERSKEIIKCHCVGGCVMHKSEKEGAAKRAQIELTDGVITKIPKDLCCWEWKGYIASQPKLPKHYFNSFLTVVECSDDCECDSTCPSRVVQRGRTVPLVLWRTSNKGWSVLAAEKIPRCTFVCQYIGEVLTMDVANKRDQSYQYDVSKSFIVDAKHKGNEARFVNHSCDPNLKMVKVFGDNYEDYYSTAYYTKRDVERGKSHVHVTINQMQILGGEITVDYYDLLSKEEYDDKVKNTDRMDCMCGSSKCRKWL